MSNGLSMIAFVSMAAFVVLATSACVFRKPGPTAVGRVSSADGVEIAYTARGRGAVAIVFIHGGLADRTFWSNQLERLAGSYRVVAIDLAGHGESGRNRSAWTMTAFAEDVRAVADGLSLRTIVLVGNSLGGPVALEAARLMPGRVIGVVGVDTFQDATVEVDAKQFQAMARAFRDDFHGACRAMASALFHPGSYDDVHAWVEGRMCATSPRVAVALMEGLVGYDPSEAFRRADVPIRAINGDLWPTSIEWNRAVWPDFDAVIMTGCGHYPMLERPDEFNRRLAEAVRIFERR